MTEGQEKALSTKGLSGECRENAPELSADELLARLVQKSPKAEVTLAGVPVTCILDTGAETSLVSHSFYKDHLADKMSGIRPLGTYLQVYGVSRLELPIEGCIEVPLRVHNLTVDAHFLGSAGFQ